MSMVGDPTQTPCNDIGDPTQTSCIDIADLQPLNDVVVVIYIANLTFYLLEPNSGHFILSHSRLNDI